MIICNIVSCRLKIMWSSLVIWMIFVSSNCEIQYSILYTPLNISNQAATSISWTSGSTHFASITKRSKGNAVKAEAVDITTNTCCIGFQPIQYNIDFD